MSQTSISQTVGVGDPTAPSHTLKINADGSINIGASASSGASYKNITTATTTLVKTGAGTLFGINVNTYVASATITLYDNTTAVAPKIGTITLPSTITGDAPTFLPYNLAFATGLTIVTSGTTDLTVSYA